MSADRVLTGLLFEKTIVRMDRDASTVTKRHILLRIIIVITTFVVAWTLIGLLAIQVYQLF